ncbi:MAG: CapA family protein [Clostridia bacterium]|nr:CapA family protein [Clostridia bacterium]
MSKKRKPLSTGSVVAILAGVLVTACALYAMIAIRGSARILTMDAEHLVGAVSSFMNPQTEETAQPQVSASVVATIQAAVPTAVPSGQNGNNSSGNAQGGTSNATAEPPAIIRNLTVTLTGKMIIDAKLRASVPNAQNGATTLFDGISDALHADINVALLDTAAESENSDWWARALQHAGIDAAIPAAKNSFSGSLDNTSRALNSCGIGLTGAGNGSMITVNGVSVAFLTVAEAGNTADAQIPAYDMNAARNRIQGLRSNGAQVVIVAVNWRKSNATLPTEQQKKIAQELCDAGADIIVGEREGTVAHAEMLTNAVSGRQALVVWSMGTLLGSARDDRAQVSGFLMHVQLAYNTRTGVSFGKIEYTPTFIWGQEIGGAYRYRVVQSALAAPDEMIARQSEIMGRALKLVQDEMDKGIALQRY